MHIEKKFARGIAHLFFIWHNRIMDTAKEIIAKWPSVDTFADDLGISPMGAYAMQHRNRIDAKHWVTLVHAARNRRITGITYQALAEMADRRSKPSAVEA